MANGMVAGTRPAAFVGVVCLVVLTVSCVSDAQDPESPREDQPSSWRTSGDSSGGRTGPDPSESGPTNSPPDQGEPTGDSGPGVPEEYHDLVARAAEGNLVRVIVTMRLESTPGPEEAYRQEIANTADELFDEMAEFDASKGHVYRNLPMFAAEVDEAALRHLIRSEKVEKVSEDTVEKPQ